MILTDEKGNKFEFIRTNGVGGLDIEEGYLKPLEWPQEGDKYWYVNSTSIVLETTWDNDNLDESLKNFGNMFHTEEEAEIARDKIKDLLQGLK